MLVMMGEISDQHVGQPEFSSFTRRWFAPVLAVLVRTVRSPALAYDLATETFATAHIQWDLAPEGELAVEWVLQIGADVLNATVTRGRVPSTERRRTHQSVPRALTVEQQQEIANLVEHHIELPAIARQATDALARTAPPPHVLEELALSSLMTAETAPNHQSKTDGT